MKRWFTCKTKPVPRPSREAEEAMQRVEDSAQAAKDRWPAIARLTYDAQIGRDLNHFGEAITASMQRKPK